MGRELGEAHRDILGMGGFSMLLGGCIHLGSGPAISKVFKSGPAFMTAGNSLPLSGKFFNITSRSDSGGSGRWAGGESRIGEGDGRMRSCLGS